MRKTVSAVAALLATAFVPAMAADIRSPAKAPAAVAAPMNWTGFYIGINGGGGMANADFLDPDCNMCANTKFQTGFGTVGGQVGYNWQWRAMVIGLEYDFNWTSAKDTKEFNDGFFSFAGLANFKFDYFASARARMGLAFDNALVYVTAGPAWGHFDSSVVLGIRDPVSPTVNQLSTDKAWHMGLAAGVGVEYMLTNNWTLRGEYLFLNFKDVERPVTQVIGSGFTCGNTLKQDCVMNYTYSAHVARLGVNYKFGY